MATTSKNKNKNKTTVTIPDYTKQATEYYADSKASDIKSTNALYDSEKQSTNESYDKQVFDTNKSYQDQYRENAVQKEINKRQVAESMANLGLTDSGLNRTQLTAAQLSYGNNKATIDSDKQNAINDLEFSRSQAIDTIEQNRASALSTIDQNYASYIRERADTLRSEDESTYQTIVTTFLENGIMPSDDIITLAGMDKTNVKALYNAYKKVTQATAEKSSSGGKDGNNDNKDTSIIGGNNRKLSRDYTGNLEDNDVEWYTYKGSDEKEYTKYTDRITGKTSTFRSNVNPYSGTMNYDTANGVWSNTKYQPTNITLAKTSIKKANGVTILKGEWIDDADYKNKENSENLKLEFEETTYVENLERDQNVFKTASETNGTQYWMWDDSHNRYFEVYKDKKTGKWNLKQ